MAKYTIEIDDSTKVGAGLLEIARTIAKQYKSVHVHETVSEDDRYVGALKQSRKTGKGDKKKVLDFLKTE